MNAPLALLAELTHRCPLRCPYCSNPLELTRASGELTTAEWANVFAQAAELGCLQAHLSGGEPTARRDIVEITAAARDAGLYTNLITAGVLLDAPLLARLQEAGLDHVQLSIQDAEAEGAERIGGGSNTDERNWFTNISAFGY
jgi:pyrroloquinoline quinone biosynthesis protein E